MIVSRTIAKRRIAAGACPSWRAAWGLVAVDFVLVMAYAFIVAVGLYAWMMAGAASTLPIYAAAFILVFVPIQGVLITSALWAAKSRWVEVEPEGTHGR